MPAKPTPANSGTAVIPGEPTPLTTASPEIPTEPAVTRPEETVPWAAVLKTGHSACGQPLRPSFCAPASAALTGREKEDGYLRRAPTRK